MSKSVVFLLLGLCALVAVDAFAPTAMPLQNRARLATSSSRPAAAVSLRMNAGAQIASAAIKLAAEAAPAVAEDNTLLLLGGAGFSVLIPLIVVVFVVSSQGVFKKSR
eukprot:CAMPEP_0179440550 /NCGR_PEP_ID=MMETSP0799-20121207/24133_1 /TAXON_ID=46947 /ORGANISM="Geminigera cryophila, Strain CCMP2564" /LENGTH=107 /DNA_ID=CAMNT_0021223979 /DNA_START=11 /DNA_END=334 /DNA_ORIENTATION=+